ncbi:hypothetical protein Tco_1440705 [Tanacetum coccineum]
MAGGYDNCKDKEVYETNRMTIELSQRMGSLLTSQRLNALIVKIDAEPVDDMRMIALTELKKMIGAWRFMQNLCTLDKWTGFGVESSSSKEIDNSSGDETLTGPLYDNFKREKAYKAVPPPTGTIIPPRANVSFTGIDELAIRNKVVNQENTKSSQPEFDRNKVIIEDWVDSDDEETDLNFLEIQKKTVLNSANSETSFEKRSPTSQNSVGQGSRKKGLGHKGGKTCLVCYSPDHLIKDYDLHERTFKQTQTHKPKGIQGSRDTRPVWNNIKRVNHSNFSGNSRYPHQKMSFIPSVVLTWEGLKSTARPKMTQTVPSKSTANVFYQGTARPRVPQAVLSQSTGRPYYPRMDNIRPRTSSFSPSTRSSTTRTPHRPQRPKKIMKSIWVKKESTVGSQAVLPQNVSVKGSAMIKPTQTWRPKGLSRFLDRDNGFLHTPTIEFVTPFRVSNKEDLKDYAIIDSGCSGSMTGDKDKLSDFKEFKGGYVAFGNDPKGGRITRKGTIKTSCIDFEKVSYVEELKFNLLSVSQICDKKHNVLFTDKECLILSPKFKFVDEDLVILRAPRKNDVYSLDLKNIIPSGGVTCLVAKGKQRMKLSYGHKRLASQNKHLQRKRLLLQRKLPLNAFEEEKRRIALKRGKVSANSTVNTMYFYTPSQNNEEDGAPYYNTWNTPLMSALLPNTLEFKESSSRVRLCKKTQEISSSLADESWVEAMQEELLQFKLQDVWVLCDLPDGKRVIGTKWVFRNKRDERDDVKSAFVYGNHQIRGVVNSSRFEDLHIQQVLQSSKGTLWATIKLQRAVYVDDIIFGSTKSSMVKYFEELMQKEFKMSSMDEDDEDDEDEDENENGWDVDDEWLMALVTPPLMPVVPPPSTFKVVGPSTVAPGLRVPVGRLLSGEQCCGTSRGDW